MKCPYRIDTITETSNKNTYNDSRRIEHQTFPECLKESCPFHYKRYSGEYACIKVDKEKAEILM